MSKTDSIFKRLERLKHIGEQLAFKELSLRDKKFLSDALIRIGEGEDPSVALDCSGQLIPDSGLDRFSAFAGGTPSLKVCGLTQL